MPHSISKAYELARFALEGHQKEALDVVRVKIYGNSRAVGLRRDLSRPLQVPKADLRIEVRPLQRGDDLSFLRLDGQEILSRQESRIRRNQLQLVQANIPTCYVAVSPNGDICYMQWLLTPGENEKIQAHFGRHFPLLNADEALVEGAYTVPRYRGKRIMGCAMAQIAKNAEQFGMRWVITFVARDNAASLKGCHRAGFVPYVRRDESWRMFHYRIKFNPL